MSFAISAFISAQRCRVLVSHHASSERLTLIVADAAQRSSAFWAISDSSSNGTLLVTSGLSGRTLILAGLTISRNVMNFTAPDNSWQNGKEGRYTTPIIDLSLSLGTSQLVQSVSLCFTSTLESSSKAIVQFALGDDLNRLIVLQQSTEKVVPWPA